jgi:hypothetical protein
VRTPIQIKPQGTASQPNVTSMQKYGDGYNMIKLLHEILNLYIYFVVNNERTWPVNVGVRMIGDKIRKACDDFVVKNERT